MAKINRLSLFIINNVKFRRLVLGISTRKLSELMKKSESYIGLCEGMATDQKYNSADYPFIAEVLGYSLTELMPPDDWEVSTSHDKVEKNVSSLVDPDFVRKVLQGIKQTANAHVLREENTLFRYLNVRNMEEKKTIISVLKEIQDL